MYRTYSRRATLRLGARAAAAAVLATACGGGSSTGGGQSDSDLPRDLAIQERPKAKAGAPFGALRLGALAGDADPNVFLRDTRFYAYSRLVAIDPRTAKIYPDLALSVETPDAATVRFSLTGDARFHSARGVAGQTVDAEAVRRDFARRAIEGEPLFKQVVDRVDADGGSLTLHLRGPFALLFELLAAPEASIRSDDRYPNFPEALGSGPFVPTQLEEARLTLVRHPLYHAKNFPRLDGMTVTRFANEADYSARFAAGDVDVWTQPSAAATPGDRSDATKTQRPAMRMRGLGLSLLPQRGGSPVRYVAAFQDQRVRRALALALDRSALLRVDGGIASGPVGPAHRADALPKAELAVHPLYQRNVAEAQSLLRAANQEKLAFRIQLPDLEPLRSYGQLIVEQVAAAGFEPRPLVQEPKVWQSSFAAGDFEAVVFELGGLATPDVGLRLHTAGGVDGRFSLWGYSNPVYDAAVRDALSALNPGERARKSREAQRMLLNDVPAMFPIAAPAEQASIANRLNGYEFDGYDFNSGWLSTAWELKASGPGGAPGR